MASAQEPPGLSFLRRLAKILATECRAVQEWDIQPGVWRLTLRRDDKKLVFHFDPDDFRDQESDTFRRAGGDFIERCLEEFGKPNPS